MCKGPGVGKSIAYLRKWKKTTLKHDDEEESIWDENGEIGRAQIIQEFHHFSYSAKLSSNEKPLYDWGIRVLQTEMCPFKKKKKNFLYWRLNPRNVTIFGDGAFKEVMKVKWSHKAVTLI